MLALLSRVVLVLEQAAVESMRIPASAPIRSTVADLIGLLLFVWWLADS
jgi:hypothetical protein